MKYDIETEGQKHTIELHTEGDHAVATIDDRAMEVTVCEPEPGVYSLIAGTQVLEVRLLGHPNDPSVEALVRGRTIPLRIIDRKHRHRSVTSQVTGKVELTARMPGKVIRWLCQPGENVQEGQGLVVVEAMKMQNEVRSPKSGTVAEICVAPGQTVNAGEILAVVI
jgi:biotin carboxyl carrier protein